MDDIGTLIIRVYTSRAQIPISGATVVVTHEGKGGRRELLSLQVTDSSGAILPLRYRLRCWERVPPRIQMAPSHLPYAACGRSIPDTLCSR